jgi:hypothetical protein
MVAGFYSGIAQDEMCQMENDLVFKKEESRVHCGISGHQLSQSCGFESQSRDWANNIVRKCPCSRGRLCVLQKLTKSHDQ